MGIKVFTEKEIRKQLIKKLDPKFKSNRSGHDMGWIEFEGMRVFKVKLPNNHSKEFYESKAKKLARSLRLKNEEYNKLIECTLSGSDYYKLLKENPERLKT